MLASTFYDPVVGLDIHIVLVPAPPAPAPIPTPIPIPFVGLVFDPLGLLVGAGLGMALGGGPGIVAVNGLPATNCGTEATLKLTCPHLPAPGVAFARGIPGNDAELYFGGYDVSFAGSFAVRLGDVALSCSDPVRLPTSFVMALPKGRPVLVMRPMVPDLAAIATAIAFHAAMAALRGIVRAGGRLFRALRRIQHASPGWARLSNRLGRWVDNIAPQRLRSRIRSAICHLTGHPVDVATGRVLTSFVDFELPGPIPLRFERNYDSSLSWRDGRLGYGWSHSLDQAVWRERGKVIYRAEDGREIEFHVHDRPGRSILDGEETYLPFERLHLRCLAKGCWEVRDSAGLTHEFSPVPGDSSGVAVLTGKRDRNGHRLDLTYDSRGLLDTVRDSGGRLLRFEHDRNRHLVAIKLPVSRGNGWYTQRTFLFDDDGDLVEAKDSLGKSWRFDYATHLLVREADRTGLSFYFQYDGLGSGARCIRTWGDGGIYDHVITYDMANQKTVVEDSVGAASVYEFDELGHVIAVVDPLGGRTEYEFDPNSARIALERKPSGGVTRQIFDDLGNMVAVIAADGSSTEIHWDTQLNVPIAAEDPSGGKWLFGYDRNGNLVDRQTPDGGLYRYQWADGLLAAATDPDGRSTTFHYDDEKNLARVGLPNGGEQTYRYNGLGALVKRRNADGVTTTLRYDSEGRLIASETPLGLVQAVEYNAEGKALRARRPNRDVVFEYEHLHRLSAVHDAGACIRYEYDTEDRLVAVVNEHGERYEYSLDRAGNVQSESNFAGATTQYRRDKDGRATAITRPSGRTTELSYDAAGRCVAVAHSDGTGATYEFDKRGLVVRAQNDGADVLLQRDRMGRVSGESQDGGVTWVRSTHGVGQERIGIRTDLGARQEITFGPLGKPDSIRLGGEGLPSEVVEFARSLSGAERARRLPGGIEVAWSRDALGRPTERRTSLRMTSSDPDRTVRAESYRWRGLDQIEAIIDSASGPRFYEHDPRGRLVRARSGQQVLERGLDATGNVFRTADLSGRVYEPGGRLREAEGMSLTYDEDGNRIERVDPDGRTWRYRWGGDSQLAAVDCPDGRCFRFAYDAFGRRTLRQVVRELNDGSECIEAETRFVWDIHNVIHEIDASEGVRTWYWEPGSFSPLATERGGRRLGIAVDHLGAPTEMYDELGQQVWQMQLDVFGVAKIEGDEGACPWRWPGQYAEEEIGLVYNRYRYYDPRAGVFASEDPVGLHGGMNPFAHVPDPVLQYDPLGLDTHIGDAGERAATRHLEESGFEVIGPIQNRSGHGIDLVYRDPTSGRVHIAEVKANSASLSPAQARGADAYGHSRLSRSADWEMSPESRRAREALSEWVEDNPTRRITGVVIYTEVNVDSLGRARGRVISSHAWTAC